jgi:hypothetical protein
VRFTIEKKFANLTSDTDNTRTDIQETIWKKC